MLTVKQKEAFEAIETSFRDKGISPSFEELKHTLGLASKSGVHRIVKALEERGYVRRLANRARALEILKGEFAPKGARHVASARSEASSTMRDFAGSIVLPLMGRIAAGVPISAIQIEGQSVVVPSTLVGPGEHFALTVVGDSMIGAGIMHDDTVVIRRAEASENGSIVVALVDDEEATLKRVRHRADTIVLEAANPAYEPRTFQRDRIKVQGRLVGLMRAF